MNRYDELEREWTKWHKNRVAKRVKIGFFLACSIVACIGIFLTLFTVSTPTNVVVVKEQHNVSIENAPPSESSLMLSPSFSATPPPEVVTLPSKTATITPQKEGNIAPLPAPVASKIPTSQSPTKQKIVVQGANISLEERFTHTPSASLALAVANSAYTSGDYKKSAEWAMKASELSPNTEEAWLVFAKANTKTGEKAKAKRALEVWLSTHDSPAASALLDKINKGQL